MIKTIFPTIEALQGLSNEQTFIFKHPNEPTTELTFRLSKDVRKFTFSSETPIPISLYDFENWRFPKEQTLEFIGTDRSLFCQGNEFIVTSRSSRDLILKGDIYGLRSTKDFGGNASAFYRYVSIIKKGDISIHDFHGTSFSETIGSRVFNHSCIPIILEEGDFHFYTYDNNDFCYVIIDSIEKKGLSDFKMTCYNILLSYATISGTLLNDDTFIIKYENAIMSEPISLSYISLGETIRTKEPILSINFHTLFGNNESIELKGSKGKKTLTTSDIYFFKADTLSNLVNLISKHEKVQRASLLFVSCQRTTLEMKIPALYVALEAISSTIFELKKTEREKSNFAPIKDKKIAEELVSEMVQLLKSKKEALNVSDEDFNFPFLVNKISYLNSPPNADKLKGAFDYVNFTLTEEELGIIKNRDRFLHGNFVKGMGDEELFLEALHASLKISHLIGVLLLRLSNYTGPMLNYPARYSQITGKSLDESTVIVL